MKYEHHCDRCVFLETMCVDAVYIDIYYHPGCALSTVYIARFNNRPDGSVSSPGILAKESSNPGIRRAYELHQEMLKQEQNK